MVLHPVPGILGAVANRPSSSTVERGGGARVRPAARAQGQLQRRNNGLTLVLTPVVCCIVDIHTLTRLREVSDML